jgi:glycosyltransferase involved in cell wall biosynthesis
MPSQTAKEYDVCFITFNKVENDARTINMAKTLVKHGKKVCIIGLAENSSTIGSPSMNEISEGVDPIVSPSNKRGLGGVDPIASPSNKRGLGGVFLYTINQSPHPRMWNRWLDFSKQTKRLLPQIKARCYIAEDFNSLHIVRRWTKKEKSKFIYDSREIYSASGPLYKNKAKQKILSQYERYFVRFVDEIIVSGKLDAEYLKKYFKHNIPYHIIMNLPYYSEPVESDIIRKKYDLPATDIAIIYQGMILPGRGIEKIIESLHYINHAHFFILGEGGYRQRYEELSKSLQLDDRVHFCGMIPYKDLHKWTCSADIGVVFIEPISFSYKLALPNKLFEYCMAGIPSLVSDLPAMRDILEKDEIGMLIDVNAKPQEIAEKIEMIIKNRDKYQKKCKIAARKYSYETQAEKIIGMVGE